MAWIAVVPPSPRHPYERYQARYQDGKRQRSADIFPTKRRAEAEQRAVERGRSEPVLPADRSWDGTGSHALGVRHRRPPPSRLAGGADSREEWAVSTGNADH
jgi:hypothetical protein